ncbi:hypothetical protein SADUNF_Sadunf15G0026600 [Salix dunnii]|uniref:Uncharacterized protein n=1 Tax=Salix dunnii TaxID=1413687 RepID=A0A835JA85_9ROSI|nr:hypothetical protein SADUNF_Sadunf15G0026600 [Salix dunnii]
MGLQWMILTYVVAAEAAIAALLTLPSPKLLKDGLVSLISLLLQPALFIVPCSGFLLLGLFFVSCSILLFSFRLYKFWSVTSVIPSKVLCIYKFTPLGLQSSRECDSLCFSMPSLLVCLPYMQILQGNPESRGSGEEVQEPVVFPAVHPHFINRGREVAMLYFVFNIDITSRCFALFASSISSIFCGSEMYFLLALSYCIFSYQRRLREYYSMNASGWKGSHSIFDIVFVLIYQKLSFLVEHYPLVHSG